MLYRDDVRLHLLRRDEAPRRFIGPGTGAVPDPLRVDVIFARAESLGPKVLQRPDTRPWRHRDYMVADPVGNVVWKTTPIALTAG